MGPQDRFGNVYNSLSGLELKKKILHDVEVMLDSDDRFRNHIAYPKVAFSLRVEVEVWPMVSAAGVPPEKKFANETGAVLTGKNPREEGSEEAEAGKFALESQHDFQHPDQVRAETGQVVPRPQGVKDGNVVDLTKEQVQEQRSAQAKPPERAVQEVPNPNPKKSPSSASSVDVGGTAGHRTEKVEIEGHVTAPHEVSIPGTPAKRVSIANEAALSGDFEDLNIGRPVGVPDIVPRGTRQ